MKKTAIVTGLRGQDGSWLADKLIERGYKVYGTIRRASQGLDLGCSSHLEGCPDLEVAEVDLTDPQGLVHLCNLAKPDLFFNMAAQSHVGTSFKQPHYTSEVSGVGVLNCLEAIRLSGIHTRFLQASTSELYGGIHEGACNESSRFYPKSPYGCAKLFGYWITVNYRESYKMFACNSICFNHECFFADTPVLVRKNNNLDIVYVSSLVPNRKNITKDSSSYTKEYEGKSIEIWDGERFVELKAVSRRKLNTLQKQEDQKRRITNAAAGSVSTTPNHKLIDPYGEKMSTRNFCEGSQVKLGDMPPMTGSIVFNPQFAEALGMLCRDGHINNKSIRLINNEEKIRHEFFKLISTNYCGLSYRESTYPSGFGETTTHIDINGLTQSQCSCLQNMLYDSKSGHKKVPQEILNSSKLVQLSFLKGYFQSNDLKKINETYEFSSFKTNSPLLAQGILYLISCTTKQSFNINTFEQRGKIYYQVNLHSLDNPHNFGMHLKKEQGTIKKMLDINEDNQNVFDIETATGKVMAGIGVIVVGNSERRGPNFVTRKITRAVARIKSNKQDTVHLGNLDAKRDWGYAPDFVEGMIMMLDAPRPNDYVLATGETHSVREFCQYAFEHVGLNYKDHVVIDPRFYRPAEVDVLLGDHSKITRDLGWKPKTTFKRLVQLMVDHDLAQEISSTI